MIDWKSGGSKPVPDTPMIFFIIAIKQVDTHCNYNS